jgi:SAM-dependent methyltransferase
VTPDLEAAEDVVRPPAPDDPETDARTWFHEHYHEAAEQVVEFLAGDDISLEGRRVADVGCGDGILDLGVFHRGDPQLLVGYDVRRVDVEALRAAAQAAGIEELPDESRLSFVVSEEDRLPVGDRSFEIVFSWSTFEHVRRPVQMLREIRRVLDPQGVLFLQIWPLYYSQHGGHLWQSIPEPFPHLDLPHHVVERRIVGRHGTDRSRDAIDEFRSLNRMTLDDLQRALLAARLRPVKVELQSETFRVPENVSHVSLSDLAISGIKLLAVPD